MAKKRGPKPKIDQYYVNPEVFREQLKVYYETDNMTKELGESINKIANGLGYKSNFINYTYKDDMIGDALVKMYTALKNKKFDLETDNSPFSYFTTIAFHAFINRIKKEKKYTQTLNEYKEMVYTEEMLDSTDGQAYIKPTANTDDE